MKVIIPAAGGGVRFRPLTDTRPKVLLHVAGKPIIGHIVDLAAGLNPEEVIVVVGQQGEQIEQHLRSTYAGAPTDASVPRPTSFAPRPTFRFVVQAEPLGLGHAVAQAAQAVQVGPVLIILGDTILDLAPGSIPLDRNAIGVRWVPDPRRFGVAETAGDVITRVVEKPREPRSNLTLVGVYFFTDSTPLFSALNELIQQNRRTNNEYQLTDALQIMVERGIRLTTFPVEHWLDCGTPDTLLETNRYLLSRRPTPHAPRPTSRPSVAIIPPVYIADTATIENSSVGPSVSIGERVVVRRSTIRDSILHPDAVVENATLEHAILGFGAKMTGIGKDLVLADGAEFRETNR